MSDSPETLVAWVVELCYYIIHNVVNNVLARRNV